MTSKNILFLGSLLFVLLVTSCVAYFMERYNPMFATVTTTQEINAEEIPFPIEQMEPKVFTQKTGIKPLLHENNTTLAALPEETRNPEKTTIPETETKEENLTVKESNQSSKKVAKPVAIATKINKKIIPSKQLHKIQKRVPQKVVRQKKPVPQKKKRKIVIEPVIVNRTLEPAQNGRLSYSDRQFLQKIATQAKRNRDLYVLLSTVEITPKKRKYLQNVKAFLKQKGLISKQIKIEIHREKREKKVVFSEQKKDKIELSLIERI